LNKTWNLPKIAIASFDEIKDERPAFLVTFAPAWNVVKDKLRGLNIIERVEATKATTDHWDSFLESDSLLSNMREQAPALKVLKSFIPLATDSLPMPRNISPPGLDYRLPFFPLPYPVNVFTTAASSLSVCGGLSISVIE